MGDDWGIDGCVKMGKKGLGRGGGSDLTSAEGVRGNSAGREERAAGKGRDLA